MLKVLALSESQVLEISRGNRIRLNLVIRLVHLLQEGCGCGPRKYQVCNLLWFQVWSLLKVNHDSVYLSLAGK